MTESPVFFNTTSAAGFANVYTPYVEKGKRRLILYGQAQHDHAAGSVIDLFVEEPAFSAGVLIQSSEYDGNGAAIVAGHNYPLHRHVILSEGQRFGAFAWSVGAGEHVSLVLEWVEWYLEFEPVPWQASYL